LGYTWPVIEVDHTGASHVVLANKNSTDFDIEGVDRALEIARDVRIFGKPSTRKHRRMGVVLADTIGVAKTAADRIRVIER